MSSSLAGAGKSGDWEVDVDENIDSSLYGLVINAKRFYLQIRDIDLAKIEDLLRFLREPETSIRPFTLEGCFGGVIELVNGEKRLMLRIREARSALATNLFEVALKRTDRAQFAEALAQAITETHEA